jgi:hypothetical protein
MIVHVCNHSRGAGSFQPSQRPAKTKSESSFIPDGIGDLPSDRLFPFVESVRWYQAAPLLEGLPIRRCRIDAFSPPNPTRFSRGRASRARFVAQCPAAATIKPRCFRVQPTNLTYTIHKLLTITNLMVKEMFCQAGNIPSRRRSPILKHTHELKPSRGRAVRLRVACAGTARPRVGLRLSHWPMIFWISSGDRSLSQCAPRNNSMYSDVVVCVLIIAFLVMILFRFNYTTNERGVPWDNFRPFCPHPAKLALN